ncbi:MAG: recombinase family protein [Pseudomonadota bacterium]
MEAICDELHVERVSAAAAKRPVFDAVIGKLTAGDSLVVWDLDRAFRSVVDMLLCLEDLDKRGVKFKIVNLGVDTATESGELVATMMAAVARFERRLIARRTKEGMKAQQRRGKHVGRPKALDEGQVAKARADIDAGRDTIASAAAHIGVHPRTLSRALQIE